MKKLWLLGLLLCTNVAFAQTLQVATSFSILEDLVKNVGGARVSIANFVPRNGDAHGYQPSAQDVKALSQAKIVFTSGLGLEAWFSRLVKSAGNKATVIELSKGLTANKFSEGEEKGEFDPHVWWNPINVIYYIKTIRDALIKADPASKETYSSNAAKYSRQLADLDVWAKLEIGKIPSLNRKIVTNHDALGYLAARYGFVVIGTVIPGGTTERAPSAKEIANLIRLIKQQKVKAIFTENIVNPKLAQAIARETGATIAPALYTDALGEIGSSGETYLKAFRHNIQTLLTALR